MKTTQLRTVAHEVALHAALVPRAVVHAVKPPVNELEMAVFAVRRSGHHAVMNWVCSNLNREVTFLNNGLFTTNPYLVRSSGRYGKGEHTMERVTAVRDGDLTGAFAGQDALVYNFEDRNLTGMRFRWSAVKRLAWLGKSRNYQQVVILRDPFNNFASRLRWARGKSRKAYRPSGQALDASVSRWKDHAKLFLRSGKRGLIGIDYNRWFCSRAYREQLAGQFGWGRQNEDSMSHVPRFGPNSWGDSFDGLSFEGRASEMKVFDRWRAYIDDEEYMRMFRDQELQELTQMIYGDFEPLAECFSLVFGGRDTVLSVPVSSIHKAAA